MIEMLKLTCVKCGGRFQYARQIPLCMACQPPPPSVIATGEANWQALAPESAKVQDDLRKPGANAIFNDFSGFCAPMRGLWITGPSRAGKTWLAWRVLRVQSRLGRSIACIKAVGFNHHMDTERLNEFKKCAVLLIDDIDKVLMHEKNIALLYEVIDCRVENHRQIIATSNTKMALWSQAIPGELSRFTTAFDGRLKENLKEVALT